MEKAKNYSFMLLLAVMMASAALYFSFSGSGETAYQAIKVAKGDSLWSLAEDYEDLHKMDQIEFIKWVQDENNLITTKIVPGEELTIPVPLSEDESKLQLADGK
ncbi:cell division suppressor protein YneA [Domibacillus robiginosus]|uniref:cell division suppressor protein YneA n=1 Tax=Domibacillus robiginosus TaxID=1071054 RepID=UPI00067DE8F6|nr:LysM peptidoglycan-binding domain-containing protein [Domibacillus robiginosus]